MKQESIRASPVECQLENATLGFKFLMHLGINFRKGENYTLESMNLMGMEEAGLGKKVQFKGKTPYEAVDKLVVWFKKNENNIKDFPKAK